MKILKIIIERSEDIFSAYVEKAEGISFNNSSGLKKPRQPQLKKIEEGLHRLAAELQAVELV